MRSERDSHIPLRLLTAAAVLFPFFVFSSKVLAQEDDLFDGSVTYAHDYTHPPFFISREHFSISITRRDICIDKGEGGMELGIIGGYLEPNTRIRFEVHRFKGGTNDEGLEEVPNKVLRINSEGGVGTLDLELGVAVRVTAISTKGSTDKLEEQRIFSPQCFPKQAGGISSSAGDL